MPTYPGTTGHYSPAAWHRAQLMTDGQITDGLLAQCETALADGAPDWRVEPLRQTAEQIARQRVTLLRNLLRTQRDAVWLAERELERFGTTNAGRELFGARLAFAQAEMVRLDAELIDAELAMRLAAQDVVEEVG